MQYDTSHCRLGGAVMRKHKLYMYANKPLCKVSALQRYEVAYVDVCDECTCVETVMVKRAYIRTQPRQSC